ncbi:glycosyltransferase family 39 protein [Nocardia sp. NBC_01327]|uniref:glycosyltransferase family 39 protein n=1 Tax=Nocardia sp. NBC_01327 TaxID=2903593 RepID=UPI002E14A644|nr:glycosyltransferase family 39 protein [Nocardia sp. NBC_01327]
MYWVATIFAAVLAGYSNRYGYHRDEMYFLAAGRRLDWGYPDQPPLVPLIARGMAAIDANSLILLRIPAIVAAVGIVLCAGWTARELGAGRVAQTLSAAAVASAALLMGAGHLLGTTVFDLAVWSAVTLLILRLLREASDPRWWLPVGVLVGIGLQNKALAAIPVLVLAAALAAAGPRKIFATRYFPIAIGIAGLIVLPYLWWQACYGWPQWEMSRAIAGGSSGTSNSPIAFVLLQFGLIGPLLVPLWGFGLYWLWRRPRYRAFVITYAVLFAGYLVAGGKAYYLGGMYPLLLAAGSTGLEAKLANHRIRSAAVGFAVLLTAAVSAVLFLPVLPASAIRDSPVLAINFDAGETIGWPAFVHQIAAARAHSAPDAEILTANYGEAAAIERFGGAYRLPTPHSGHNAYWWWGPPATGHPVLTVGIAEDQLRRLCSDPELLGHIDNGLGIHSAEQGKPIYLCRVLRISWDRAWPAVRHLG